MTALPPGSRFAGGRYTIGRHERRGLFADLYQATDATSAAPLSIHLIDPRLVQTRALVDRVAEAAQRAAAVDHKSIAQVIELAVEGEHTYLATELVEGHSLRELLERKRQTGTIGFGAKGALNIVTHVSSALSTAAPHLCHGAVTVESVAVNRAGRIRVTDFGLFPLVPVLVRLGGQIPGCAPEVVAGAAPTEASDVFCVGALLYEVLVGAPPIKGCTRPSQAVPGISPAVDQIIARAMSPTPERRYPNTAALVEAAAQALADAMRTSAPQPVAPPPPSSPPSPVATTSPPRSAPRPIQPGESHPSLAEALAAGPGVSAQIAVSSAPAASAGDGDEKWLVSKGKLDYGPFSLAQIVQQIESDQIQPGHVIIDKDTGHRRPVEDHPLLSERVDAAKHRRDELRRAQAEVQHASQEKRRGTALYALIGGVVIALGGGTYLLVEALSTAERSDSGALSSLEAGSLQTKISFPSKAERQKRARARRTAAATRKSGAGPSGVAGGWDDSLNLDLSDDDDGGSDRLTENQVNPVIQGQSGALGRCLTSTGTHNADIEFIVKPTGKVQYVRVNGQTDAPVANCMREVMKRMQFPTFDGVRSKHYFDMAY